MFMHRTGKEPLTKMYDIMLHHQAICWHIEPRQHGHHLADNISKCIFVNEKFCISILISLKFVSEGQIDSNSALVQVIA